jgi:hypothetical protein
MNGERVNYAFDLLLGEWKIAIVVFDKGSHVKWFRSIDEGYWSSLTMIGVMLIKITSWMDSWRWRGSSNIRIPIVA